MWVLLFTVGLLASLGSPTLAQSPAPGSAASPAYDSAHRPVSTQSAEAQRAFDEGLTLLDAFNPREARRAFRQAATADPNLAMAYWGTALSYGVNINTDYDPVAQRSGHDAIVQAQAHEAGASGVERALIAAAQERYAAMGPGDADRSARAFRDAMAAVALKYPNDDDVLTLAAEAELDVHAWNQWTSDGRPVEGTERAIAWLKTVLARDPAHIQAEHLYIHAVEASPHPGDALDAARRLAAYRFEPAAEHLTHMPAHTFMRVGEYTQAGESNTAAIAMFDAYLAGPHEPGHESYRGHDCSFAVGAFAMAGTYTLARDSAAQCGASSRKLLALTAIRFRNWQDLAPVANVTPYTDAVEALRAGNVAEATRDEQTLRKDKGGTAPIAVRVVQADIDAAHGQRDAQIADLVAAVELQDGLGYGEPPAWYFPIREALGAAYFEAGRYGDAERAFRDDLARNPQNPRSLYGLARTLERENRAADAAATDRAFQLAWQHADEPLTMEDI
jgi:tetratricopeptide (TPR) repeat protein